MNGNDEKNSHIIQYSTKFLDIVSYNIDNKLKKGRFLMKNSIKKTLAVVMTAATLLSTSAASMSAFAATNDTSIVESVSASNATYVEDHSKIDCTNRYKMNDGRYNFTLKIPKGVSFSDVTIKLTRNSEGTLTYGTYSLSAFSSSLTYLYDDDSHYYYQLLLGGYSGVGVKLYCPYNGGYYMATDNGNFTTIEGRGYWLN